LGTWDSNSSYMANSQKVEIRSEEKRISKEEKHASYVWTSWLGRNTYALAVDSRTVQHFLGSYVQAIHSLREAS